MDPDFVFSRTDMGRRLLFAFIDYEVEHEPKPSGGPKDQRTLRKGGI